MHSLSKETSTLKEALPSWDSIDPHRSPFDKREVARSLLSCFHYCVRTNPEDSKKFQQYVVVTLAQRYGNWMLFASSEKWGLWNARDLDLAAPIPTVSVLRDLAERIAAFREDFVKISKCLAVLEVESTKLLVVDRHALFCKRIPRLLSLSLRIRSCKGESAFWYNRLKDIVFWALESLRLSEDLFEVMNGEGAKLAAHFRALPQESFLNKDRSKFSAALAKLFTKKQFSVDAVSLHERAKRIVSWKSYMFEAYKYRHYRASAKRASKISEDWHVQFILDYDLQEQPRRGALMIEALHQVRSLTHSKMKIEVKDLCLLAQLLLGTSAKESLRKERKPGRNHLEYYRVMDDLNEVLTQRLLLHQTSNVSPVVRAARAYLDISFIRPFVDGNRRLARLVFDFILSQATLGLREPESLFCSTLQAGDIIQYEKFLNRANRLADILS